MEIKYGIDEVISLMKRYTKKDKPIVVLDEQEDEVTSPSTETGNDPGVWSSGVARGKANPIDDKSKWESGITRGKANPIDDKSKWESGITRGKANPLK